MTAADLYLDGARVLDDVRTFVRRFVAAPSAAALDAITLWAAHSHLVHEGESSPRLALLSPEPGSGKSRTLEVLELLTPAPMMVLNASAPAIFRTVEAADPEPPTLLFDEVDAIFGRTGKDDPSEDLRALLNAGHRRGATIPRCVGPRHDVVHFPVFTATALAGLGDLPDTLMSRSVIIRMRRRAPGEHVEPYRRRLHERQGWQQRDQLAAWCAAVAADVGQAWPEMPEGITDRPADCWEPLLAVADEAGGHWPATARSACVALCKVAADRKTTLGVRLLGDLRAVFGDARALHTNTILERLCQIEEAPWSNLRGSPLDARGLANRLRDYDVQSTKVKVDGASLQGYRREDLWDAWERYLSPLHPESPERAEPAEPASSGAHSEVPDAVEVPEPWAPRRPAVPEPETCAEPTSTALTCTVPQVPESPDFPGGDRDGRPSNVWLIGGGRLDGDAS